MSDTIGASPNAEINLASDREHKCVSKTLGVTRGTLIKMIFAVPYCGAPCSPNRNEASRRARVVRKMHASSVADSNMAVDLGGFASQTVRYAAENKLAGRCEEGENDDPTGSCRKAELELPNGISNSQPQRKGLLDQPIW